MLKINLFIALTDIFFFSWYTYNYQSTYFIYCLTINLSTYFTIPILSDYFTLSIQTLFLSLHQLVIIFHHQFRHYYFTLSIQTPLLFLHQLIISSHHQLRHYYESKQLLLTITYISYIFYSQLKYHYFCSKLCLYPSLN